MLGAEGDLASVPRRRSEDGLPVEGTPGLEELPDTFESLQRREDSPGTELIVWSAECRPGTRCPGVLAAAAFPRGTSVEHDLHHISHFLIHLAVERCIIGKLQGRRDSSPIVKFDEHITGTIGERRFVSSVPSQARLVAEHPAELGSDWL